jgi:hypothetical protein
MATLRIGYTMFVFGLPPEFITPSNNLHTIAQHTATLIEHPLRKLYLCAHEPYKDLDRNNAWAVSNF